MTFSWPSSSMSSDETDGSDPTVTLLERRHLISGSLTTGFRTWEAALHLGSYLLSDAAFDLIRGKSVIELGAGTGFLSALCGKHLDASHVTTTDGDEAVVETVKENLFLNGLDDARFNASVLRWGGGLAGTWVEEECEEWPYDMVLGSDIVSQRSLYFIPLMPTMCRPTIKMPYSPSSVRCGRCSSCVPGFKPCFQKQCGTRRHLRRSDMHVVSNSIGT